MNSFSSNFFNKLRALFFLMLLINCSGGEDNSPLEPARRLLYTLDNANDAVYILEGADTATGEVVPVQTLTGENTLMENPRAIAVDGLRDILYVADATQQLILVYAPASTLDGDVTPRRTLITSNIEGLDGNVQHLFLDQVNNQLYAYNLSQEIMQVWNDVSTANDVPPNQTFLLDFVTFAMFVDTQRDLLYMGDFNNLNISSYNQPSSLIGTPVPLAILQNDEQPFDTITGLTMNVPNDDLYVLNPQELSIEIFEQASTLPNAVNNNNSDNPNEVIPTRTLSGTNTQISDDARDLLFLENVLYVLITQTQIGEWDSANTVDGDIAPDRIITVTPNEPVNPVRLLGFAVDLSH